MGGSADPLSGGLPESIFPDPAVDATTRSHPRLAQAAQLPPPTPQGGVGGWILQAWGWLLGVLKAASERPREAAGLGPVGRGGG